MQIPLVIISIAALIAIFGAVYYKKSTTGLKPWTYENWLEAGAIFLLLSHIMNFFERDVFILGSLGTIYVIIGLFGKYITKDKKMNKKQQKNLTITMSILPINFQT